MTQCAHISDEFKGRHPGTTGLLRFFDSSHLREELREIPHACQNLALLMARALPDGPELTAGLRKLLEAKDAFVRAKVASLD